MRRYELRTAKYVNADKFKIKPRSKVTPKLLRRESSFWVTKKRASQGETPSRCMPFPQLMYHNSRCSDSCREEISGFANLAGHTGTRTNLEWYLIDLTHNYVRFPQRFQSQQTMHALKDRSMPALNPQEMKEIERKLGVGQRPLGDFESFMNTRRVASMGGRWLDADRERNMPRREKQGNRTSQREDRMELN